MTKLRLDQIEIDPTIQIRQRIDEAAVERYAEAFDELPPPVVYQIDGVYLLSDGMHRLAAANRINRKSIEVEVRQGSRADAEVHAITANTKNAVPLTANERDEGIRRLKELSWGRPRIATAMSLPERTVKRIWDGLEVRARVSVTDRPLSRSHYEELAVSAPRELQQPLATAASEQGWNSVELRNAAKKVAAAPEATIYRDEAGTVRVNLDAIQADAKRAADNDALAALYGVLSRAGTLREYWTTDFLDDVEAEDRRRIEQDVESAIRTLTNVLQLLETKAAVA